MKSFLLTIVATLPMLAYADDVAPVTVPAPPPAQAQPAPPPPAQTQPAKPAPPPLPIAEVAKKFPDSADEFCKNLTSTRAERGMGLKRVREALGINLDAKTNESPLGTDANGSAQKFLALKEGFVDVLNPPNADVAEIGRIRTDFLTNPDRIPPGSIIELDGNKGCPYVGKPGGLIVKCPNHGFFVPDTNEELDNDDLNKYLVKDHPQCISSIIANPRFYETLKGAPAQPPAAPPPPPPAAPAAVG